MGIRDVLKSTFLDTDGSFCLPELGAIAHGLTVLAGSVVMVLAFIRQVWIKDQAPSYADLGTALGAMSAAGAICVAALGKAMQWRDGQGPKRGERDADDH